MASPALVLRDMTKHQYGSNKGSRTRAPHKEVGGGGHGASDGTYHGSRTRRLSKVERVREEGFGASRRYAANFLTQASRTDNSRRAFDHFMEASGTYEATGNHLVRLGLGEGSDSAPLRILDLTCGTGRTTLMLLAMLDGYHGEVTIVANDVPTFVDIARIHIMQRLSREGRYPISTRDGIRTSSTRRIILTAADISQDRYPRLNGRYIPRDTFVSETIGGRMYTRFDLIIWAGSFQMLSGRTDTFRWIPQHLAPGGKFAIVDAPGYNLIGSDYVSPKAMTLLSALAKPKGMGDDVVEWVTRIWLEQGIEIRKIHSVQTTETVPTLGTGRVNCITFTIGNE